MYEQTNVKHLQSTYVDNIFSSADSNEKTAELYTQAKEIFRQGNLNPRKFLSNSQSLQTKIESADNLLDSVPLIDSAPANTEVKVFGVAWKPHNVTLLFDISDLLLVANSLQRSET